LGVSAARRPVQPGLYAAWLAIIRHNRRRADYRPGKPDNWIGPEKRIDRWGISEKHLIGLGMAEEAFRFCRERAPAPGTLTSGD
jgi:hypothetical protein